METEPVLGWMFAPKDRRIAGAVVEAGKTLIAKSTRDARNRIAIRPLDALRHAVDPIVCRVETSGSQDKRNVKVLWLADASEVLHIFACDVAEQALNDAGVTDERCRNAVEVKRRWIKGEATDKELKAAAVAAWTAVAVAWEAWTVAWEATGEAAWSAAQAAAREAAWEAAQATAEAAWEARAEAAWTEAWSEARDAESSRLNADLEARLMTLAA